MGKNREFKCLPYAISNSHESSTHATEKGNEHNTLQQDVLNVSSNSNDELYREESSPSSETTQTNRKNLFYAKSRSHEERHHPHKPQHTQLPQHTLSLHHHPPHTQHISIPHSSIIHSERVKRPLMASRIVSISVREL